MLLFFANKTATELMGQCFYQIGRVEEDEFVENSLGRI